MKTKQIALLTLEKDLHGALVYNALANYEGITCHLIAVDRLCDHLTLSWSNYQSDAFQSTILSTEGVLVKPKDLNLIWWRRSNPPQIVPPDIVDNDQICLIRNDCYATLTGLLANEFAGKWVNEIDATRLAENKLIQLRAAQHAGFQVPRTLISNDPTTIRRFCKSLKYRVVVKAVRGTAGCHFFTRILAEEHLTSDGSLRLSPAIYQELIPGYLHWRVHCFGDNIYAVAIESQDLDWRENLNVPFETVSLNADIEEKLRKSLRLLGLRMGVVDLKLTPAGVPVWLEINPQGQFLFSEALSGLNLTQEFSAFLALEA